MIHMESILETSGICYLSKLISLANNIENWKKSELGIECLPHLKKGEKVSEVCPESLLHVKHLCCWIEERCHASLLCLACAY